MKKLSRTYKYQILLAIYDVLSIIISLFLSLILCEVFNTTLKNYLIVNHKELILYGSCLIILYLVIYSTLRLYQSLWRYASVNELVRLIVATLIILLINGITSLFINFLSFRFAIVNTILILAFSCFARFIGRVIYYFKGKNYHDHINTFKRVLIVGAGDACGMIVREITLNTESDLKIIGLIDDDESKLNQTIFGYKVMGNRTNIKDIVEKYNITDILIAMPSVSKKEISSILDYCTSTKAKIKVLPGISNLVNGTVSLKDMNDVQIEDLLGRDPIVVNLLDITNYVENQVVLVTGGGGSIGSELCRQLARYNPSQLIILDIYENNAYEIEQELRRTYPLLNLVVLIGSVRDHVKVNDVFSKYHPDIVYHAAAHKHVPLMETSPNEAVKNNVFGTLKVARAADQYHAKKFILISTDKAVNPTNIMGATKRICEMIIQTINKHSSCEYVAVRFGNVLGSNGSVIPLFKKQIKEGGPVTVTHKEITRFFMTIPEAVSLVLQAGAYALGGEIFILDMGQPVKIYDLATRLISLSGYTPGVDIKIEITGLRPGEKLYEELLMKEEGLKSTPNHLIHIGKPIVVNEEVLFATLDELYQAAYNECDNMKELVSRLVPTYHITNN